MSLYGLLGKLEQKTLWDTMTKEVVGINLPKTVFTRTPDERLDSATSEIGNTVAAFGIGGLLDYGLKKLFQNVQSRGGLAEKWSILGRTGAMYSAIFALMWAMPFARNYLTTQRTGKTRFTDVIDKNSQSDSSTGNIQEALDTGKRRIKQIVGIGALATAFFTVGGFLAAKRNVGLGLLKHLFSSEGNSKNLLLKDGSFHDFSGLKAVLFWGLPAYAGWYDASRDPYEKKEQLSKFASFVFGFSGPEFFLKRYFKTTFERLLPHGVLPTHQSITTALEKERDPLVKANLEKALSAWKKKNLWTLLTSIGLLSGTQLLNFHLTGRRLAKAHEKQVRLNASSASMSLSHTSANLRHKSFSEWGLRSQQAVLDNGLTNAPSSIMETDHPEKVGRLAIKSSSSGDFIVGSAPGHFSIE